MRGVPRSDGRSGRGHRYAVIADDLRERVASGEFPPGRLLPSEASLGASYGASRVTIRKALDVLRADGALASRQGFGWFVPARPLRQSLAQLGTIEADLAASGRVPERRVLRFAFMAAPRSVRDTLGPGRVLEVRRLNLADGVPFAVVTVWCPERYGRSFTRHDVQRFTFYELLDEQGVVLGDATQTIGAAAATTSEARLLEVPTGSPVLRCRRTTNTAAGDAVLLSAHVFPGHLTEFVAELPRTDRSIAPSGLRLVNGPYAGPA